MTETQVRRATRDGVLDAIVVVLECLSEQAHSTNDGELDIAEAAKRIRAARDNLARAHGS